MVKVGKPMIETGDGVFGRVENMSSEYINFDGRKVIDMILHIPVDVLKWKQVDLDKEGIDKSGLKKGIFIKRTFPIANVLPPISTFTNEHDILIRVTCGLNGEPTQLTKLYDYADEMCAQYEKEIDRLRITNASLNMELERTNAFFDARVDSVASVYTKLRARMEENKEGEQDARRHKDV